MTFKRELEKKFVVYGPSLGTVWSKLKAIFPDADYMSGISTDTFWNQNGTDFIRLRANTKELSVKITDKSTIEDRVEENMVINDLETAQRFATAVFGKPVGTLEKNYYVLTMPEFVIALYTVTGREEVFLEVESDTMFMVNEISDLLQDYFDMEQEMRSLFQIVFGNVK